MKKKIFLTISIFLGLIILVQAQSVTKQIDNIKVSSTTAKYLGKSKPIRALVEKSPISKEKKEAYRRLKKVPDNFKGRKPGGNSVNADLEHQGADPIRQMSLQSSLAIPIEPLVNVEGLSINSSPQDPTGDVSDEFYVQAINVTMVGVFDLEGNLVQSFAMNTLWAEFNASSLGDPIVLYDENAEKWFITEFTSPANLLIAVSETKDPLGSYHAYSFSTPEFPDYPKYAITPTALVVTTNEASGASLHQYFLDIQALYAGMTNVNMIRVEITGNGNTEAGFYVTTPVDWNGTNMPFDNRPIAIKINDSSWPEGAPQDQIDIYSFNLDFITPNNTTVDQTSVITTPFDPYPCSQTGMGFQCVPQQGGGGLDAVPEVIMNIPHLRNFGTHESMVFNFVTDVTDGQNRSGIRWVELRRTATTDWELYQEGTFGLDDGLDRFMGSIAIDGNGNIGLAYNVTSANSFVGVRFTGRYSSDPLGEMTVDEYNVIEGSSTITSFGRFGDYSQLSVSPLGNNTFWFTTEYAKNNGVGTRIVAFQFEKDSFDLSVQAITEPISSSSLGIDELVTAEISNLGVNPMANYELGLIINDTLIETTMITDSLQADSTLTYQFTTPIDMSAIGNYEVKVYVNHSMDQNLINDTLTQNILKLVPIDGGLVGSAESLGCDSVIPASLTLTNLGGEIISTAAIEVIVNGMVIDTINYAGSIVFNQSTTIDYSVTDNLQIGNNSIQFTILTINGITDNETGNNTANVDYHILNSDSYVTLVFNTDEYPEENSWTIAYTNSGAIIASGDFDENQANFMFTEDICLPLDSCYTLTVTDAFGDGIEGNFSILDSGGATLVSNDGDFGDQAVEEFCPSSDTPCLLTVTVTTVDATGADIADGSIMIEASNGPGAYEYSIDGGATFQDSNIFEGLLPNMYDVLVTTADSSCYYMETVTVDFSTGIHHINGQNVEVKLLPNPTTGVFKVIISNLQSNEPLLKFEIFDLSGKLVQQRTIGKYDGNYVGTLSLYDFPNGNYFLRVLADDIRILERIVKID